MADGDHSDDEKVNEYIFCKMDSESEEQYSCPPGYSCQKSNANEAPGSGVCYLTDCKKEGTECFHDTECCREVSETHKSPLDCVNGICQVLMF